MDLSYGRMKSRLRKLRRDPAAFAADLPWLPARTVATAALAGVTSAASALDRTEAAAARHWREQAVRLRRRADGLFAFSGRDGSPPTAFPALVEITSEGRGLILCAFTAEGALSAAEATADAPAVLALAEAVEVRVYATDGGEPPESLDAEPITRAAWLRRLRAQGAALPDALARVWPAAERRPAEPSAGAYSGWIARNEPSGADHLRIRRWIESLDGLPRISVLMPVHDPQPRHLRAAIASVMAQLYGGWELCIADDGSRAPGVSEALAETAGDPRVRLVRLGASRGVAAATNAALELATGEACLFLDHDDVLVPHALALIAAEFAGHPEAVAVYTDEDTIDLADRRSAPLFKPDFDAERLLAQNYVNHAFAVRTGLLRRLGGLRQGVEGAQDHDLALRVAEAAPDGVRHIPQVLYGWRVYPGGASLSQRRAEETAQARARAVRDHLGRTGQSGEVSLGARGYTVVRRPLSEPVPAVLAIVPTRDRPGLLAACAAGLLRQTHYPALKLRIVDNGSRDPETLALLEQLGAEPRVEVMRVDQPFNFSALNNAAARGAKADLLLFLNDDVLAAEPGWLRLMVSEAARPEIGAVGAKLFYPDGRLQHAGVVTGLGPQGVAGHEFRGQPGDTTGPQSRLLVQREVTAVTAACMVLERRKFEQVGGFDEALAVAFNDVDLCLKLRRAGYRNLWTPHARLIHAESATRGSDRSPERAAAFAEEARQMRERWGEALTNDPYHSPNLSLEDESFALAARSRAARAWATS
ncbi:MAG TPA: glycosyltransferase family 2 protein [Caulobacteraceae bacterium]